MNSKTPILCILVIACAAIASFCQPTDERSRDPSSNGLQIGVAAVDITPEDDVGVDLSGYGHRLSTGAHDPVTARCLVIDDGNTEIALVSLDFSNLSYSVVRRVVSRLARASGISKEHIFIHATHTHSGPSPEYFRSNPAKFEELIRNVARCMVHARNAKKKATAVLGKAVAHVDTINREYPAREVENTVHAIEFLDSEKNPISILVNFACHPVVLGPDNLLISSDYVHFLRERLEETLGGTAIFFSGCLGDINPKPVDNRYSIGDRTGGTFKMAQDLGYGIADGVLIALQNPEPLPIAIRTASKEFRLRQRLTKISIITLGEVWIITVPGEPFSSFQQRLETLLPATTQLYLGLTHDRIGYIMPEVEWRRFVRQRPDEAHEGGDAWAAILESKYLLLADEILKQGIDD